MAPGDLGYSFVPFLASPFERPSTTPLPRTSRTGWANLPSSRIRGTSSSSIAIEPPTGGVPPGRVRGTKTTASFRDAVEDGIGGINGVPRTGMDLPTPNRRGEQRTREPAYAYHASSDDHTQ